MIAARRMLLRFGAIVLAQHLGLACAQAQALRHDVFERPALGAAPSTLLGPGQAAAQTNAAAAWNPEVTALVVAGSNSLANLNGTVVRIGGEIDGYRLVEVREREAVFVKNKKRYRLALRGVSGPNAAPPAPAGDNAKGTDAAPQALATGSVIGPDAAPPAPTTGNVKDMDTSIRGSQ